MPCRKPWIAPENTPRLRGICADAVQRRADRQADAATAAQPDQCAQTGQISGRFHVFNDLIFQINAHPAVQILIFKSMNLALPTEMFNTSTPVNLKPVNHVTVLVLALTPGCLARTNPRMEKTLVRPA